MNSFRFFHFVTRCTLLLLLVQSTFIARAQAPQSTLAAPALPDIELSRTVSGRETLVTLRLPQGVAPGSRTRIAIFERNRPARLADVRREWSNAGGRWQTQLRVEADPGIYELRVLSDDKARTPLSLPANLLVPGIDREPGWWLFNGSPFVEVAPATSTPTDQSTLMPPGPLFVPGLQRDLNRKSKSSNANILTPNAAAWRWKTVELPGLASMLAANYDWNGLRSQIQLKLEEARKQGERHLIGFSTDASLAVEYGNTSTPSGPLDDSRNAVLRVKQVLNVIAPEAALILHLKGDSTDANAILASSPALFDAIWIENSSSSWPLKVARRIAEEQPAYDLPIWTQTPNQQAVVEAGRSSEAVQLDHWLSGATGKITRSRDGGFLWQRVIERNLPLFIGSVTLEDMGLLPVANTEDDQTPQLYSMLRSIGRIPLLARTQLPKDERRAESLMVRFGPRADQSTLNALRAVASAGARVYIEGVPTRDEKDQPATAFASLVNATISEVGAKSTTMALDDVWTFGTARGTVVPVEQRVVVAMKPTVPNTRKKKDARGVDELTSPRVLAKLADGSPALIQIPIGDGQILWSPNPVPMATPTTENSESGVAVDQFYAAIAGLIQPALVQVREASGSADGNASGIARGVRVALRSSSKGTLLLGVFNETNRERSVVLQTQAGAEAALDLATEQDVLVQRRGFASTIETTLPAGGWKLLALAATRKALDDERNAPRLKARLR